MRLITLQDKIGRAIKLLQSIPQDGDIELAYSGGKDSDVILALAKMAGIPHRVIHKVTTIDPPGTIKHAIDAGAEIMRPKRSFFELIRQKGTPSRRVRFCCEELKEYAVCDRSIVGARRDESVKRAMIYREPEHCRVYRNGDRVKQYLPIVNWTDGDIREFVDAYNVKCHPLYYHDGRFDVSKRLGCIGCPLASIGKRKAMFRQYPKMLRLWIVNKQRYYDSHPNCKSAQAFSGNAINSMFYELFCGNMERYNQSLQNGLFPEHNLNPKSYMEDYFKIDL